jgi:hypothetical protein
MLLHILRSTGPSIFQILTRGLSAIKGNILFLFFLIIVWTAYRFLGFCVHFFFYFKLKNKNLDYFIKVLGNDYHFKKIGEGDKRYKWTKWYIVIKANFDSDGRLVSQARTPFKYWHYSVVLSFQ